MNDRRSFLRQTVLAALAVPGTAALLGAAPAAAAPPLRPAAPQVRRLGRHYLVNGWILTRDDLAALGLEAA